MGILAIIGWSLAGLCLLWWYGFWNYHGNRLQDIDGYIPPKPGFRATKAMKAVSYIGRFVLAGDVVVIGRENLEKCARKRLIVIPNHVDFADWSVIFPELGRPTRYMSNRDQLSGVRRRVAAFTGALAVNNKSGESRKAVLTAAVQALDEDGTDAAHTIFMQGKLVRNGQIDVKDFQPGAVLMGKRAVTRSKDKSIVYLPMGIAYAESNNLNAVRRFCTWLGAKLARSGDFVPNVAAVLVIGEPVLVDSLPEDTQEAKAALVEHIRACVEKARAEAAKISQA